MSYPNTKFEVIDDSEIIPINLLGNGNPTFLVAAPTAKGTEELTVVQGSLVKQFGEISFSKYGQGLLQAERSLNAGADVIFQRLCAPNALLANVVVVARVKASTVQKVNAEGLPLFLNLDLEEVTVATVDTTPIMISSSYIIYELRTVAGAKTLADVKLASEAMYASVADANGYKTFPLFIITDIGRGVSNKKIRISAEYTDSKRLDYTQYRIDVIENNDVIEYATFSFDPDKIVNNSNISLESVVNKSSTQIKAKVLDIYCDAFIDEVETLSGITGMMKEDALFGRTKIGKAIHTITVDGTSVALNHIYGNSLISGSNGTFGNKPAGTAALDTELVRFFKGEITDKIFDLDQFQIDAVIDAKYPLAVKKAIEDLCQFRQDFVYFRDLGDVHTYDQIELAAIDVPDSRYIVMNYLSFDTVDPTTRKIINVTMGYSLSQVLVDFFLVGRSRPFAGVINGAVLTDAIKGTENYLPKVTPNVDQKAMLYDLKVNYASYIDNKLVIETQLTAQSKYTELSYINNVLNIQNVIKDIRVLCPRIRYSFVSQADLIEYKSKVDEVIKAHRNNFSDLTFEYISDSTAIQNKVFKAALGVKYKNWVESEWFVITILPSTTI